MTIQFKRIDGSSVEISAEAFQAFKTAFRGALLTADDPPYDEVRQVWNAMIDRRPALIARCSGTVDVVRAVQFAREQRIVSSVRGGGHNIAGLAVCNGGLMINLCCCAASGSIRHNASAARRPAARWPMWTARRSCTGWRPCSASSPPPASPASPWAAASAT